MYYGRETPAARTMLISVEELREHPVRFDEQFAPGHIDYLTEGLQQVAPLRIEGNANLLADEIEIRGHLETTVELECGRCLEPVRQPVDVKYDLIYRPMSSITRAEEFAIPRGEEEIGYYQKGGLLLEDVAKEQVLLALPMAAVCRDGECRGLCKVCGGNLNREDCGCDKRPADPRWQGLLK